MQENIEKYRASASSGMQFLMTLFNPDGSFKKTEHMLTGMYKAPLALLTAGYEAEAAQAASLAQLSQEGQVQDQLLITPRAQEIEQFVHDQEQTLVGVLLVKGVHHGHQQVLAVGRFAECGAWMRERAVCDNVASTHYPLLSDVDLSAERLASSQ